MRPVRQGSRGVMPHTRMTIRAATRSPQREKGHRSDNAPRCQRRTSQLLDYEPGAWATPANKLWKISLNQAPEAAEPDATEDLQIIPTERDEEIIPAERAGRGPDQVARTRRTYREGEAQTPAPSDWTALTYLRVSEDCVSPMKPAKDVSSENCICDGGMQAATE